MNTVYRFFAPILTPIILVGVMMLAFGTSVEKIRVMKKLVSTQEEVTSLKTAVETSQAKAEMLLKFNKELLEWFDELANTRNITLEYSKDGSVISQKVTVGSTVHVIAANEKLVAVRVVDGEQEIPVQVKE